MPLRQALSIDAELSSLLPRPWFSSLWRSPLSLPPLGPMLGRRT
jgi:hypothetical protein